MALTLTGSDVVLKRNNNTGKYDLNWETLTNNPEHGDDQSHAVFSLLYERKSEYAFDPSGIRGSYLWSLKDMRRSTPSKVKAYIEDALQPLIDQGKILKPAAPIEFVTVSKNAFSPNRLDVNLNYSLPNGSAVTLRPSLGY